MGTEIHSSTLTDRFVVVGKRKIKKIFVDETLLKINDGQDYWLWLAYDEPNLHVCLLFHISRERTIFVCYQFFRQIRTTRFGNKPIFTDGTHWYNDACR
jgi:transposase-like protein